MTPTDFSEDPLVEQPAIALFDERGYETANCFYKKTGTSDLMLRRESAKSYADVSSIATVTGRVLVAAKSEHLQTCWPAAAAVMSGKPPFRPIVGRLGRFWSGIELLLRDCATQSCRSSQLFIQLRRSQQNIPQPRLERFRA